MNLLAPLTSVRSVRNRSRIASLRSSEKLSGSGLPTADFDRRNGIVPSPPGVVFKCVLEICCVTKISEEFRQHGVGQRLAVGNHAVKIENQCTQSEAPTRIWTRL